MEKVDPWRNLKFVVKHHDSHDVPDKHKHMVIHLLLLIDILPDQFSGLETSSPYHLVGVLLEFILNLVGLLVGLVTENH